MVRPVTLSNDLYTLLSAAAPSTDDLLPIEWWVEFINLFTGVMYTPSEVRSLLDQFNARQAESSAA